MLTGTRFAAASGLYLRVKIKSVCVTPYDLAAAQYVEWAVISQTVPYLASTGDIIPSAATSASKVLTLRGARSYQQGNGKQPRCYASLAHLGAYPTSRFTTDVPVLLTLHTYSKADVAWNLFFTCKFSEYYPSV